MAQHDYNLINQSGASFRADLNNALAAIATNNSGTSEPSTTFAYEWWIDTSTGLLKIRNSANSAWITTGLNLTQSNTFSGNATTATTLETARTINGVSFNGSANISFNTDSVSEGSSNLYFTNERVDDRVNDLLVAGTGISLTYDDGSNTLTIANTNDADITGVIAGNGLSGGGTSGNVTLNIDVDDSSIQIGSGALRVKNSGITNTMLAGSIANSKLSNSSVTINSQSLALGGSLDLDTSEIPESGNLYYTSARANTDFDTRLATKDTDNLAEGDNLYYTQSRFDTAFGNKTTANLTENTNLYYTTARANTAIDSRVVKSFVDGLGVAATTAVTLLNSRDISLSGDVVGSVSFNGSGNVDIVTTIQANSVALGNDTTGNYIQTISGTANKITVSGSGSESADVTLTLPDDVQIADSLTVAGNLTVNGTLVSLDTTNLDIADNLFQLNAGLTGSPVNDSGMLINRGNQDNAVLFWDESADKFTLGLTTADGSSTGNITLSSLGTLVANLEGNVTGQVSDISNFTTANLTENTNLYYTTARSNNDFDTRLATKDTGDLSEGSNLYYTDARVQAVSINNVVEDTTPQLGGDLDLNSSDITGTGDINITGTITSSGNITGTLATAAQSNITSVGTLTGFTSTGIDDNATSTAITIDSSENVGIGATPKAYHSDYKAIDINNSASVMGYTGNNGAWLMENLYYGTDNNWKHKNSDFSALVEMYDGVFNFFNTASGTAGATATLQNRLKIDQSGNLLVGKTSASIGTVGCELRNDGYILGINDGDAPLYLNRLSSDGDIAKFYKDGTVVGSIGTLGGHLTIGNSDTGIIFQDGEDNIQPLNLTTNAARDASIDLGSSSNRFKDLYLSGNASVGGIITPTLGTSNFIAGVNAGNSIQSGGNYNVLVGNNAGTAITTGDLNVALGNNALTTSTTGASNTAIGAAALQLNTTGSNNSASGYGALYSNTTASNNTANGYFALFANTTGAENTAVGSLSLDANTTGSNNEAFGYAALSGNTTGANNVAIGTVALLNNTTASNNTAVGRSALTANTTGTQNNAFGQVALATNTTGNYNCAFGRASMNQNTTGSQNVAMGVLALDANTTASNNTAVGYASLGANTTGTENVAVGKGAGDAITTGGYNTVVGTDALGANTTADFNTAIGRNALKANTTGGSNVAIGGQALDANTTASNNTAVGTSALGTNTTGTVNTGVGANVLVNNTTGSGNTALGYQALKENTTGANTAIGWEALLSNTTGNSNVAMGAATLDANTTGTTNTAIGDSALGANTTASNNTGIGYSALAANTTGYSLTAIGKGSLTANTTADNNTAVGYNVLHANTTGDLNVALGSNALFSNVAGDRAVAIGHNALRSQNPSGNADTYNVAIGLNSQFYTTTGLNNISIGGLTLDANTTGSSNTAIGQAALGANTTASNNTAVGKDALLSSTTGAGNVAVGKAAGGAITTGGGNIMIGPSAGVHGVNLTTGSNNICIGDSSDVSSGSASGQIALGSDVSCTGDNNFTFGISSTDSNIAFGATSITAPSDIRLKEDIQDEEVGLDFINDLRPVTFQWKKEKDIPSDMKAYKENSEERTMNGKYNHGFIAQEVKEVIDNHNLKDGFDMWQEDEADGRQRIAPNAIMSVMVKAVQELSTQVDELKAEIQTLKGE